MKNPNKFLGKAVLLLITIYLSLNVQATTYYFSSTSGDDNRSAQDAQNINTPWRTISKLNQIMGSLSASDIILFKKGDVFEGTIICTRSGQNGSPITFGAYGSGSKPVISGFAKLENWSSAGINVWEANVPEGKSSISVVLFNGSMRAPGRYPNASANNGGYLTLESFANNNTITDNELSAAPNWTGGDIVIRKNRWVLDKNLITWNSGNSVGYNTESGYWPTAGYGYFIQNHASTLDLEGEWAYTNENSRLRIYTSQQSALNTVYVGTRDNLVTISNQGNLKFENLSFRGANTNAFQINNSNNIAITNCDIEYSGINAFNVSNSGNLRFEGLSVYATNNIAFYITNTSDVVLIQSKIRRTGVVPGMGKGDSGSYEAVMVDGHRYLIEHNEIDSTGYIPITFRGSNVAIKNNYINNFGFVKDDGGGIYNWNNEQNPPAVFDRVITGNVVLNGTGAGEGTSEPDKKYMHGIYLDDNSNNVTVSDNTVANCGMAGLYIHNGSRNTVQRNTFYNNKVQVSFVHDDVAPNYPIYDITFTDNILFSLKADQVVVEYKSTRDDLQNFGNFNNNYYCRPLDDNAVIHTLKKVSGNYIFQAVDLEGWQTLSGKDAQSKKSPKTISPFTIFSTDGSNKFTNGTFNSNIGGLYSFSPANNCVTSWNNNALDGGSLQVGFSSITNNSKGTVIIGVGNLTAGKQYQLRFSLKGAAPNKMVELYLRKSLSPYNDVSSRILAKINSTRTENSILFTSSETVADASIGIDIPEQTSPLYFDNIQLVPVTAGTTNPADSVRFIANGTAMATAAALTGNYIDAKNSGYSNNVTVQPFSSVVLISTTQQVVVTPTPPPAPPVTVTCSATGSILREVWTGIGGNDISGIPQGNNPSSSSEVNLFEGAVDAADNYGSRIRGYICPPQTGNYTFWIAGDDATELWLSATGDPLTKVKIAYSLSWTNLREWERYPTQRSATIYLQAGTKYYIEALQKEGGGGDHVSVAWQLPDGSREAPIAGNHLSPFQAVSTPPPSEPQPSTPPVVSCSATGVILREQWNGIGGNDVTNIPLAAIPSSSVTINSFEIPENSGDQYGSRIRGYICAPKTGNYIFWISGDDATELWLSSDDQAGSKVKIAYNLSWTNFREWNRYGSQKSASVYLEAGKKYYVEALHKEGNGGDHLSVAWQLPDGTVEAPIAGTRLSPFVVEPVAGNTCSATGTILREQWSNVGGASIIDIPLTTTPAVVSQLTSFEGPKDIADNYGSRIRGYICPPQTGNYTFWIAGDDAIELWLSTSDNPSAKTKIAYNNSWTGWREWTWFSTQKSAVIYLEANKKYYIEALQKEAGGGDHLSVSWQLPDGTVEIPIPGSRLSPAAATTNTNPSCENTGSILLEKWSGVGGVSVANIPLNFSPSSATPLGSFEIQPDADDNYGVRVRGWVCPPQTGSYTFWIAGDDNAELWLSTTSEADSRQRIAYHDGWTYPREWWKYASQKSASIYLEAGRKYYIEALMKEAYGGDNLAVQWQLPGGATEIIPGNRLMPYSGNVTLSRSGLTLVTDEVKSDKVISLSSELRVNPNPVRTKATVRIRSSQANRVVVEIYDGNGRRVKTLFSGMMNTDETRSVEFNAEGLSAGLYFVKMTTGKTISSERIIVAK